MSKMLQSRLRDIKDRAAKIGLSVPQLCHEAGVDPSTIYRWLEGKGARLDTSEANVTKLEASLQRAERDALRYLKSLPHLKNNGESK